MTALTMFNLVMVVVNIVVIILLFKELKRGK